MSEDSKKQVLTQNRKKVVEYLEKMKPQMAMALPKHLTPDRLCRIALTEFNKIPKLAECEPLSFVASVMMAGQLGLEIGGTLGHCYILPFFNKKTGKTECNFILGYRGMIDLARRSGQIMSISAHVVYENDVFEYEYGLQEKLIHKPTMNEGGEMIAVYAVARLKDDGFQFEVMSRLEVDKIKKEFKTSNFGPWVTHYEEMAKKSVVRRLFKYLPVSIEAQRAAVIDEYSDLGIQDLTKDSPIADFFEGELTDTATVQPLPLKTQSQSLADII